MSASQANSTEGQILQQRLVQLKAHLQAGLGEARCAKTRSARLEQLVAQQRYYDAAMYCLDEDYHADFLPRLRRSARYLQLGYRNNCKNCALRLCECFLKGYGVEKNPRLAAEIARSLSAGGYHAAHYYSYYFAKLGLGSPECMDEAQKYQQLFEQHCYKPLAQVPEELRLEILCRWALLQQNYGEQELFIAVDYIAVSRVYYRYSLYFKLLLEFCLRRDYEQIALEACLFNASRVGDEYMLARQAQLFAAQGADAKFAVEATYGISREALLHLAKKIWSRCFNAGQRQALMNASVFFAQCESLDKKALELFWQRSRFGASGIVPAARLQVCMELQCKSLASYFHVCHEQVYNELLQNRGLESVMVRGLPVLVIRNTSQCVLRDLVLRVCCAQSGRSVEKPLETGLAVGQSLELELETLQMELGNDVYIELAGDKQTAHLHVYGRYGMDSLAARDYIMPMLLFWRYDWKGSRKLYCNTLGTDIEQLSFHDRKQRLSCAFDMEAKSLYGPLGKGVVGLKKDFRAGDDYFITSNNFAGVGFRIFATPADSDLSELPEGQQQFHYQLAAILAIFFGAFGAHKFYHRSWLWGIVYVLLAFSGLSLLAGIIEGLYYLANPQKYYIKYNMRAGHAWRW